MNQNMDFFFFLFPPPLGLNNSWVRKPKNKKMLA